MAIDIKMANDRAREDWGQLIIPNCTFFMGKVSGHTSRYLHLKINDMIYRFPDFYFLDCDTHPVIYDYEPVDLEITVKPISK